MNLIEQYQPLVKRHSRKLADRFNMDSQDLEQEGNLMLWQIQEAGNLGDNAKAISSYVKLRVVGAMQHCIAKNLGPVAVPSNAFWQKGENAYGQTFIEDWESNEPRPDAPNGDGSFYPIENTHSNSINPEDELLLKEKGNNFDMKVIALLETLSLEEIAVFDGIIMAEEPLTTRNMAEIIGVKSPQTVVNIKDRILNKAKEVFST